MSKEQRQELLSEGAITVPRAVEFSGISRTKLYALMSSGELAFVQREGRRLIPRRALVDLLDRDLVAAE